MKAAVAGLLLIAAGALRALPAQDAHPRIARISITPYAGYVLFGTPFRGQRGIALSAENGATYGAQLGIGVARHVALVGNVAYAKSSGSIENVPLLGTLAVGDVALWFYDGAVRFRFPLGAAGRPMVTPFVQVGAGAIHYGIRSDFFTGTATNFAANAALGADVGLTRALGLQFMAKDYLASYRSVTAGERFGITGRRAHSVALALGLTVSL